MLNGLPAWATTLQRKRKYKKKTKGKTKNIVHLSHNFYT